MNTLTFVHDSWETGTEANRECLLSKARAAGTMRIDELKAFKNQRPFQPFTIFMADGRNLEISHPDAVAWSDEQNRTVAVTPKGGTWQILDLMLITSLSLKNEFSQP